MFSKLGSLLLTSMASSPWLLAASITQSHEAPSAPFLLRAGVPCVCPKFQRSGQSWLADKLLCGGLSVRAMGVPPGKVASSFQAASQHRRKAVTHFEGCQQVACLKSKC